jgi:transposase
MFIMESMGKKNPRSRRSFTPEFKAEIVELCQRGDRSVGQVAKDFDLTETAVREWLKQAERDADTRDGGLTSSEKEELAAQRRELVDPGTHLEAGSGASVLQRHSSGYTGGRR